MPQGSDEKGSVSMWNLFIAAHEKAYGGTLYLKCLYWFRTFIIQSIVFLFFVVSLNVLFLLDAWNAFYLFVITLNISH